MWSTPGTRLQSRQQAPQVVTVAKVTRALGRVLVELDRPRRASWAAPVRAYRIGRTLPPLRPQRAAQTVTTPVSDTSSGTITGATTRRTPRFERYIYYARLRRYGFGGQLHARSTRTEMPLDVGGARPRRRRARVIVQGTARFDASADAGAVRA